MMLRQPRLLVVALVVLGSLVGCHSSGSVVANQCTEDRLPGPPLRAFSTQSDNFRVTVLEAEEGEALPQTAVSVGLDGSRFGIAGTDGVALIPARAGDTLRVAFLSYHTEWVIVPEQTDSLVVALEPCISVFSEPW